MSIVLNEYEWAENAIAERDLGNKPFETLSRIAKYYTYCGCSKREVREKLDEFLLSVDPNISLVTWSDTLDSAAKYAAKYSLIMVDSICITSSEMQRIDAIDGKQLQRLAFTLLCLAKFFYAVSPKTDYWVSTPDNEIMNMANINTSIKRQSAMFNQLHELGLIRFSKKIDNLSVQVLFVEDGEAVMTVDDFRNLGYQYLMYHGDGYYRCQNCGLTCKKNNARNGTGARQKYCHECAVKIRMKQNVESVMRLRHRIS